MAEANWSPLLPSLPSLLHTVMVDDVQLSKALWVRGVALVYNRFLAFEYVKGLETGEMIKFLEKSSFQGILSF